MAKLSVVIETFNATPDSAIQLAHVLARLREQRLPPDEIETLVVVDHEHPELAEAAKKMDAGIRVLLTKDATYYGMKRHGMREARGDVVALLDSDCLPCRDWASSILGAVARGADVVAGKVRFPPGAPFARTFALFDYGHLRNDEDGQCSSFNVSNAGLRMEVVDSHPFDERLTRFGGGVLLGRRLRSLGYRIVYEPAVSVVHNDKGLRKHLAVRFRTGHEAIRLRRIDDDGVWPETKVGRLGVAAPVLIAARRMALDAQTLLWNRRDFEIAAYEIPYFLAASVLVRSFEALGGLVTAVRPNYLAKKFGW